MNMLRYGLSPQQIPKKHWLLLGQSLMKNLAIQKKNVLNI